MSAMSNSTVSTQVELLNTPCEGNLAWRAVRVVNQHAFKCSAKEEHWNKVCAWLAVNFVWGLI